MTTNTRTILLTVLKADGTITKEQIEKAMLVLEANAEESSSADPGRVLRPHQVAARLGVSRKTLCAYGKRGLLKSVYAPDRPTRRLGYTEASVAAFINGAGKTV